MWGSDSNPEASGQPGPCPSGHGQSDRCDHRAEHGRASRPCSGQTRHLLGESLCRAINFVTEESTHPKADHARMPTDRSVGQLPAVPGMHASGLTITARTPAPVALRLRRNADRRTDPMHPRDNDTNQMGQQRPHALEITRRRSSPAAGQHTVATRRTPSRKVRQIHFRRASSPEPGQSLGVKSMGVVYEGHRVTPRW
jgi:hypothetical protein